MGMRLKLHRVLDGGTSLKISSNFVQPGDESLTTDIALVAAGGTMPLGLGYMGNAGMGSQAHRFICLASPAFWGRNEIGK
jgi:hypothetical protein